jgi:hypothetical protein
MRAYLKSALVALALCAFMLAVTGDYEPIFDMWRM